MQHPGELTLEGWQNCPYHLQGCQYCQAIVPVAGRRVLSPRGWLPPHSRVCRGRSRVGGVVVTGYRTSLKDNDAPFDVSAAKEGGCCGICQWWTLCYGLLVRRKGLYTVSLSNIGIVSTSTPQQRFVNEGVRVRASGKDTRLADAAAATPCRMFQARIAFSEGQTYFSQSIISPQHLRTAPRQTVLGESVEKCC